MKIYSHEKVASDTYEMVLEGAFDRVYPGQFMHLKVPSEYLILRRPISISNVEADRIHLVYKVVGAGTKVLSTMEKGETVDILGPLGKGFPLKKGRILIVGGGMGVAPLYELGKRLVKENKEITFVLGFKSKEMIYYEDKFRALGDTFILTEDGSRGIKGNVSKILDTIQGIEVVYACGPNPLLKYVQNRFKDIEAVYLSLEERMACGIGACYGCDTKDKKYRVCHDGPVFKGKEVLI